MRKQTTSLTLHRTRYVLLTLAVAVCAAAGLIVSAGEPLRLGVTTYFGLTLLVCVVSVHRWTAGTFLPTPASVFVVSAIVLAFLGAYVAYLEGTPGGELAVLLTGGGLIAFCAGASLALSGYTFRPAFEISNYLRTELVAGRAPQRLARIVVLVGLLSVAGGLLYYQGLPPVVAGITDLASGSDPQAIQRSFAASREDLVKGYQFGERAYRGEGILRLVWMIALPYMLLLSVVYAQVLHLRAWRSIVALLGLPCILFLIGSGQRSHIVTMFLMLGCVLVYVARNRSRRSLLWWGLLTLGAYLTLTFLLGRAGPGAGAQAFVDEIRRRIVANAGNAVDVFHYVPERVEYSYGAIIISKVVGLWPGPNSVPSFSYQLGQLQGFGSHSTAYSSSTFFALSYADFGAVGVLAMSVLAGYLLQATSIVLTRRGRNPGSVVTLATLSGFLGLNLVFGTLASPLANVAAILLLHLLVTRASPARPATVDPLAPKSVLPRGTTPCC